MKLAGILCFIVDRKIHTRFLRLFDINSNELLFQSELYINFHESCKEISDSFICFPLEKIVIGVEFAEV
jgi:hypothetical protein